MPKVSPQVLTALTISSLIGAAMLFMTACGAVPVQSQPKEQSAARSTPYQAIIGKSLMDQAVIDFLTGNRCHPSGHFQLCPSAGISLWADADLIVRTVRLYLNNSDGFAAYQGDLPYGLKFYDIQGAVEYKLAKLDRERNVQSGAGRPEEGSSPDHLHYWAVYRRYDMIIVYNSPFPDEDASIHSILIGERLQTETNQVREKAMLDMEKPILFSFIAIQGQIRLSVMN